MCGIFCLISNNASVDARTVDRCTDAVAHRGPDGRGVRMFDADLAEARMDNGFRIALGHRRLSILDLTEAGAQPMPYAGGRYWVTYNGEIYNYLELGAELSARGHPITSHCDTEVLVAAYAEWGPDCLRRFNGMWSFALLDRKEKTIFVSRDRIGVKPLYWSKSPGGLAFASEIKQLLLLPGARAEPDEAACVTYLATGYEHPPATFFKDIQSFPPGHHALIQIDSPDVRPERFWFPERIPTISWSVPDAVDAVRSKFADAVRLRLRSDVPVGGCLSGGLDSSSIFIQMREAQPETEFHAFSSCFEKAPEVDERPYMDAIVRQTACRHHKIYPSDIELATDFDALVKTHDEPFGSVSVYASYAVMREARRLEIPVLLDGQGGDEVLSGYWAPYFLAISRHISRFSLIWPSWQILGAAFPGGNPDLFREAKLKLQLYRRRASRSLPFTIRPEFQNVLQSLTWHRDAQSLSPEEYRLAEITRIHLPRLLKWEDRNSMAHSIETRVPFLDVNLVELLLSMPPEINMSRGWNKRLTRLAMDGRLPRQVCWRKDKMGFETPQARWFKGGAFRTEMDEWMRRPNHPASRFVTDSFHGFAANMNSCDPISFFRLYCLDRWLSLRCGH